jgi:dipeptidyl aminopeptidase/acylaminoacyl peptidase
MTPEAMLIAGPLPENTEKAKSTSPINYVTPNDPPVVTLYGSTDRTVPYDQAIRPDAPLRTKG